MNIRTLISNYLKSVNRLNDINKELKKIQKTQENLVNTNTNISTAINSISDNSQTSTSVSAVEQQISQSNIDSISFSVVTACYNNAKYVDDYFLSLIKQDNFEKLQVIIVDDGSTDGSKDEIMKWVKLYPENIEYYYQPNKGQSEARNLGLKYVKNDWLTFIDMDDFVSENYFSEAALAISKYGRKIGMYINKWVSFYERTGKRKNDHPLNYRFNNIPRFKLIDLEENPDYFYLSVSSSFFSSDVVRATKIEFQDIKPNFEDANFIDSYLRVGRFTKCVFMREPEYYYRKRSDHSSTIDLSKKDKRRYLDLLKTGYLATFEAFGNQNIPKHVQKQIYYDLRWNFVGYSAIADLFTEKERQMRKELLSEIFLYIDIDVVKSSDKLANQRFRELVLAEFYGETTIPTVTYIQRDRGHITLKLNGISKDLKEILIDEKSIFEYPYAEKIHVQSMECSHMEYFVKVPMMKNIYPTVQFDESELEILKVNNKYKSKYFNPKAKILFYDRMDMADDNAEAMYDWMMERHPEYENCYFAVKRDSYDFNRLKEKGFKVLAYGEPEFEKFYADADFIITAAGDDSIHNYKRYRYFWYKSNAKFIFLQHGVTKDDLSPWLFGKRINGLIAATNFEVQEFRKSKYSVFNDEIWPTGFTRFDKLYNNPQGKILLSYTWRKEYEGYTLREFKDTDFANQLITLLTDKTLKEILFKNQLTLTVALHPNFNKYRNLFIKYCGEHIELVDSTEISYRDMFAESNLMITDFSSVFADFLYLGKPVIFHQFDKEKFFENHTYKPALNYEEAGLGPVVYEVNDLLKEIENSVANNFKISDTYQPQIDNFFLYRDKNNRKRLFEKLVEKYGN